MWYEGYQGMKWLYSGYAVLVAIALLTALKVVDPYTATEYKKSQLFDAYQQLDEPNKVKKL